YLHHCSVYSLARSRHTRGLRPFPTRRSSDLRRRCRRGCNRRRQSQGRAKKPCEHVVGLPRRTAAASLRLPTAPSCCTAGSGFAGDRKSTRLNSSHVTISYAVFCLKNKKTKKA